MIIVLFLLLALAALAVAVAELLFRYLEPALPPHHLWYDSLPAVHLAQMRRLRREKGGADLAFCGSSVVHSGLDPAAVIDAAGVPMVGYNAALHRGFFAAVGPWVERAVVPILRPKILVLGVAINDLNDNGPLMNEEPRLYNASLLGRSDVVGWLARRLEPISVAFRHHQILLRPKLLLAAVRHRRAGTVMHDNDKRASKVSLGPNGEWIGFHGRRFHTTLTMFDHIANGILGDYHPGGKQLAIVEEVIARLKERVPQVVLTTIPVSKQFGDVVGLPNGQADLDDALAQLRAMAARLDVPLLEPDPEREDETHYADIAHCNERGMAAWSKEFGELLGDLLRSRETARAA